MSRIPILSTIVVLASIGSVQAAPSPALDSPILRDHVSQLARLHSQGERAKVSESLRAWVSNVRVASEALIELATKPSAKELLQAHAEQADLKTWRAVNELLALMGQAEVSGRRDQALERLRVAARVLEARKALELFRMGICRAQGDETGYEGGRASYQRTSRALQVLGSAARACADKRRHISAGSEGIDLSMGAVSPDPEAGLDRLWQSWWALASSGSLDGHDKSPAKVCKTIGARARRSSQGKLKRASVVKEGAGLMGYAVAVLMGKPRLKRAFAADVSEGLRARLGAASTPKDKLTTPADSMLAGNPALLGLVWGVAK